MEIYQTKNSVLLKNILLVGAALVFGGLAFWLSKQHLAQKEAELIAQAQEKRHQMMTVLVARSDIFSGDILASENLAVAEISGTHAPLDVLTPTDFEEISRRAALRDIPRGKPILRQYISMAITERFSDLLEEGQRALTLSVDTLNSSEGMLKPGDRVDLFLLGNSQVGVKDDKKELISLLQNVTVLATGKNSIVPAAGQYEEQEFDNDQYQTLTVAVTPQEAQKMILAKDNGNIITLLRNRNDHNQLPASVLNYTSLKNDTNHIQYFTGSVAEAGALKVQMHPVSSIAPQVDYPLQLLKK